MADTYSSIKALYPTLPSYSPPVPVSALPTLALLTLAAVFALTFIFTTLPASRNPVPELGTALVASLLAGGGVVALFCTVGVYV
ncbi:hypothetical protein P7C73_g2592, partial [Tremellales sp. Uapishka_1]